MKQYDKQELELQSKSLGFQRNTYEKICRLVEILRFINAQDDLKNNLALKGGTAINLSVFNLPRLSVDIDLDFSENYEKEKMFKKREKIRQILNGYMSNEGYSLSNKSKTPYSLDSFVFTYVNAAGMRDNIKTEINYSLRSHILPPEDCLIENINFFSPLSLRTLNPIEIFASKIVAFMQRAAVRDLYDLYNMVENNIFNANQHELLKKSVIFYTAVSSSSKTLDLSFKNADTITKHSIKTDLYPMISRNDRFLFEEAKTNVISFLSKIISPTTKEESFLSQFALGKYRPELLFDDASILKRIQDHPMALWKIQNIQQEKIGSTSVERNR